MFSLYGFRGAERRTGMINMRSVDVPMITHDWRGNFIEIPVGSYYTIPLVPQATLIAGLELYLNSLELRSDPITVYGYRGQVACGYGVCFPDYYFTVNRIAG